MSEQEWRVLDGEGKELGPYSFQDLQAYYTSGHITHGTMIWTEGLDDWVSAGRVEGLLPSVPQIVPQAPAPTVLASAQPVATGGINLSPQIAGIAPGLPSIGPQTKSKAKTGAPIWLSIVTIASGVTALILYFFPWVSVSQDLNFFKQEKNIIQFATQTGMQSITRSETITAEAIAQRPQQTKTSDSINKDDSEEGQNYESSSLNLIALIAIGIGVFLALIGLVNKAKTLTMVGQFLFSASAILIGAQMAQQFPMVKAYLESQEGQKKRLEESIKIQEENINKHPIKANKAPDVIGETENKETEAELGRKNTQAKNDILKARAQASNRYVTTFEPSCFVTVAVLGISILLVVITMSSGDGSVMIVTNPGPQPLQGDPQQPGSGLRFH